MTTFYGFGRYGSYLQFADSSSDGIWRVDTSTGALTSYVSASDIATYTGEISSQLLTPSTIDLAGEHVFYEGRSDSILRTTGAGTLETLVSSADLTLAFGNNNVSGGMSFDAAGNLYWGNTTSDEIHRRTAAGVLEVVLSEEVLEDFTGATSSSFNDVFVAPDGMIYFWEGGSDSILRFAPSDPAGTLAYRLTEDELVDGPAGSDSVSTLGWYNGELTWTKITGGSGLYTTPEPSTVLLLAGGLLAISLRRRRG
jgi:sugar lactone lactonase YvrE